MAGSPRFVARIRASPTLCSNSERPMAPSPARAAGANATIFRPQWGVAGCRGPCRLPHRIPQQLRRHVFVAFFQSLRPAHSYTRNMNTVEKILTDSRAAQPARGARIVRAAVCLLCTIGLAAFAGTRSPASTAIQKEPIMPHHAAGTFEVKIVPQKPDNPQAESAKLGRMSIDKKFDGRPYWHQRRRNVERDVGA